MPTVKKNENATKDITYRVQYTYFDEILGKRKTKVETYEPPPGMKEADAYQAAYEYGKNLEKNSKQLQKNKIMIPIDVKVRDLIPHFLRYLKKTRKASHCASTEDSFKFVTPRLGHYRIIDITPFIIQNWIDYMDTTTYVKTSIVSKTLLDVMKEQGLSMVAVADAAGCSVNTVKKAKLGGNMNREIAEKIAYALNVDIDYLFDISEEIIPYSYSTKDKALKAISGLLSFAIRNLIIKDNYAEAKYVTRFEKEEKEKTYLEDYHVYEFLAKLRNEEFIQRKVVAMLAIMMEYRRGEIAGLEWPDINLITGKITINRSVVVIKELGAVEGTPKSQSGERTSYLPQQLIDVLIEYKDWWDKLVDKLGDRYDGSQRLFLQANGKAIFPTTLGDWIKKLEKKYGLPIASIHTLRASSLTMQNNAKLLSEEELAKDAGHSSFEVTREHYLLPFESERKRIAAVKAKVFLIKDELASTAENN